VAAAGVGLALVAMFGAVPDAAAAPTTLDPLPRLADGSVDFTGWTQVVSPGSGDVLLHDSFVRNEASYQVDVLVPYSRPAALFANVITDDQTGLSHTYSYDRGDAETSRFWISQAGRRDYLGCSAPAYHTTTLQGSPVAGKRCETTTGAGSSVAFSDVVRVTAAGGLVHDITLTNTGATALEGIDFGPLLDTELDRNDRISLTKSSDNALHMENATFRLYLALIEGDRVLAGDYYNYETAPTRWADVADFAAGQVVVSGVDSAVEFQVVNRTVPAGASITLKIEERLFAVEEIESALALVRLVDDDAGGAEVAPVDPAVAALTGQPLTEIGFTWADAEALTPSGYEVTSIDNVDLYDADNLTVQEIIVHLRQIDRHTPGSATFTRTVTYSGAGSATPAAVLQRQTFDTDTNDRTGLVVYSNGTGYAALPSPAVSGYWPLTAEVPAVAASPDPTTTAPVDTTVTVTYVLDEPQVAIAAAPVVEGGRATVSASGSFDPRGGALTYAWDLDEDGVYDDGVQVEESVALPLAGSYMVGLRVTDSRGRSNDTTFELRAANVTPVVLIGADVVVGADGVFARAGGFTDPGADIWTAEVSYGDGTPSQTLSLEGQSFGLAHTYAKAGVYTVTVQVSDLVGGATGQAQLRVTVLSSALPGTGFDGGALLDAASVLLLGGSSALTLALGLALIGTARRRRAGLTW
jgi:PKD repeat protein